MIEVVEKLIQLLPMLKAFTLWDDLEVTVEEVFGEAPKHAGDCQVILSMAVERGRVKDHWRQAMIIRRIRRRRRRRRGRRRRMITVMSRGVGLRT